MNAFRRVFGGTKSGGPAPIRVGIFVLALVAIFGLAVFQKSQIATTLSFGPTIKAEFAHGYKLQPYHSNVKIADVIVGTVTSSESTDHDTALVTMKLDRGTLAKLGDSPSAAITATTLLGGVYYVSLVPGGTRGAEFRDKLIPLDRTKTPVEVGDVLTAFAPDALAATPSLIDRFGQTLESGGREAIRDFAVDAPQTLKPTGDVLAGFRGTRPDNDLTEVTTGLRNTAAGMLRNAGQLDDLFQALQRSTAALAAGARPLADAVQTSPETLRATQAGLTDLRGTLNRLTTTADDLRPTARELSSLLKKADPVLERARPVISDLRDVLKDARPAVERLNPTLDHGIDTFTNLRGGVLDRLEGPIAEAVNNPWHGTGVYKNGGSPNKGYEELGYLGVTGALGWQMHDGNGDIARLAAGAGGQTLGGSAFPSSAEEYLQDLGLVKNKGPQADRPGPTPGPLTLGAPR
jgi:phospholipid/cholesterol/gamma-HCH transport system substrate-binding protein